MLMRTLAIDNANRYCQAILHPIKEKQAVMEYLHACRNVSYYKNPTPKPHSPNGSNNPSVPYATIPVVPANLSSLCVAILVTP